MSRRKSISDKPVKGPINRPHYREFSLMSHSHLKGALILGVIIFAMVALRAYKAHTTGIIHDEHWTVRDYCDTFLSPFTIYDSTNNHVLNSLSIVFMRKIAGGYEHYIRIHTVLWSVLFCLSVGWICCRVINSFVLRILLVMTVLLNWFIFDLSYLARGYAMALGVVFFTIAVCLNCLTSHSRYRIDSWWITVLFIVTNFIAMGSMLSALSVVAGLNTLYILWFFAVTISGVAKRFKKAILQMLVLVSGSVVSLLALYCRILHQISQSSREFATEPFFQYMKKIAYEPFIKVNGLDPGRLTFSNHVYTAALVLLGIAGLTCVIAFLVRFKQNPKTFFLQWNPLMFVLALTGFAFLMKVIQYTLLNMSLGMPRNSVFFVVLLLLSAGGIIDRAVRILSRGKHITYPLYGLSVAVMLVFIVANRPSLRAVDVRPYDWGKQSAVGPLVRELKKIAPRQEWAIRLDAYADCLGGPITYYSRFGYHVKRTQTNAFDILIVREHPAAPGIMYLDYHYYLDFHCAMIVNPNIRIEKPAIFQSGKLSRNRAE